MTKQEISFYDKPQVDALLDEKANAADLATVATTGSYDDLTNKPTIPAAQVNADWNATEGVAEILHKPTLATVATTGDYDDLINTPSIPKWQIVNSTDWSTYVDSNGALTEDILIMLQISSEKVTMQFPKGTIITNNTIEIPFGYATYTYTARLDTKIMTNAASVEFVRNRIYNEANMGTYTRLYFTYGENSGTYNKKTAENNNNGISLYVRS